MTATLASYILDCIHDHMRLHVGFCQWTSDDGVSLWVCSARDNGGQRWVATWCRPCPHPIVTWSQG